MTEPIPLARLTTLQVGAAPARMVGARTRDEAVAALLDVWATGDEWFVLGGGSNLLAGDEPFDGTVIRMLMTGFELVDGAAQGHQRVRIEAGQNWDEFVAWAVRDGLAGVEAMSGIPGTAGAAPIQNVGAYGQEIDQTLVEVELIDEATGEVATVSAGELGLGPRTSDLKRHYGSEPRRSAVILSITLELARVGVGGFPLTDARIAKAIGVQAGAEVTLAGVRESVLAIRASKGMVLDPADDDTRSAGSFFNNPILSESAARALPAGCPRWPMEPEIEPVRVIPLEAFDGYVPPAPVTDARVKVSAAWLIENAGLHKGFRLGRSRASLSTKHTLALTNRGGADAWEVAQLARFVRTRVHAEFGIELQPEPVFVGVDL
ncbi:UDP-N-acetylmuramate dehydrogenase [Microbacterium halophytorum]|uniref:UDP-N-acetylmuramate dehydrogenase n=1 Tax=Microbacterium halophytorum TaxID=2067568 RepID=UPI000CFD33D3|nr:UDP-N-acetylmuramate dehydrogenase [Microbacterium halophytorum]